MGTWESWLGASLCPHGLGSKARGWPLSCKRGPASAALVDGGGRGDAGVSVRWDAECSWGGCLGCLCLCIAASSPKLHKDQEEPGWGGGTVQLGHWPCVWSSAKILRLIRFRAREGAWEGSSRWAVPRGGSRGLLISASPSFPAARGAVLSPWGHTGPLMHCGHPSGDTAGLQREDSSPGRQKPSRRFGQLSMFYADGETFCFYASMAGMSRQLG